jgi:hypothetical protein
MFRCLKIDVFRPTVNIKLNIYWVIGKSPLFEVRCMDVDDSDSLKSTLIPEKSHIEKSDTTDGKSISPDVVSDEEDLVRPPSWSQKQSTIRSAKKRSSADGKSISPDVVPDEEDLVHPPSWSQKQSTSRSAKKRSSAVCVYTYKVDSSNLHLHSFFAGVLLV